jgi:hypothetical protein
MKGYGGWSLSNVMSTVRVVLGLHETVRTTFYSAHDLDHKSRFYFTVFHGHHHDVIPSAVMAAAETGFVEAMDRGVYASGGFFGASTIGVTMYLSQTMYRDMVGHQYIPGVFPYSKRIVVEAAHHVVHHFGSLRPIGVSDKRDVDAGYDAKNAKAQTFLRLCQEYEAVDVAACTSFTDPDRIVWPIPMRRRLGPEALRGPS